jgi:hypothetical protein
MEDLLVNNRWPSIFDHYEDLLRVGREAGKHVRFFEPLKSKSLYWTMSDLAADKPGISISKLAELLNLELDEAEEIAKEVVQKIVFIFPLIMLSDDAVPNTACPMSHGSTATLVGVCAFSAVCMAGSWFRQTGVISSTHQRVTHTVGRLSTTPCTRSEYYG